MACGVSGVVCFSKMGVDADLISPCCSFTSSSVTLPEITSSSLWTSSSFGVESSLAGVGMGDVLPAATTSIASGLVAVDKFESAIIRRKVGVSDRDAVVGYG